MRTLACLALTAALGATLAPCARSEDPVPLPGAAKAVAAQELVNQLGHDDFRTREAASRKLAELGESARPALERAAKDSESPEVRWRAEQLLRKLDGTQVRPLGEPTPQPSPGSERGAGAAGDDDDPMSLIRKQIEALQKHFGSRLNIRQLGVMGRLEVPGLTLDRRIPQGVVLQVKRTDALGKEQVENFEGKNLADILRRNPELEQLAGMDELKRREAETTLPGFEDLFNDDFLKNALRARSLGAAQPGFSFSTSQGVEVHQDANGARVRLRERDEDGKEVVKEYTGATLEEIKAAHPEVAERLGGMQVHVAPPQVFWPGREPARLEPLPTPVTPAARPLFGVGLEPVDDALAMHLRLGSGAGALVRSVAPTSAAARLDLRALDVIVEVNDQPVQFGPALATQLGELAKDPQAPATLLVIRGGEHLTLRR